ncbi:MAG: hypothetical protein IH602_21750 [Bryobacteraceae bacterium]|nr:hypothetical protein [Bryobacteraceae bacterium]
MSRRHLTIMTIDDHRAAAREWTAVHRSVAEFDNITRSALGVPDRLHTNVKRIHKAIERILVGMREVEARTLPSDAGRGSEWLAAIPVQPATPARGPFRLLTIDDHITCARLLGPSQPAIHRFLDITSLRRYLPVRILDDAIRIDHLVQVVRCEMEDVQFYT